LCPDVQLAPVRDWDSFGPGDLLLVGGNLHLAFRSGDQCTISPARGNCEMIFIETPNIVICGHLLMAARGQVLICIASVYAGSYAGLVMAENRLSPTRSSEKAAWKQPVRGKVRNSAAERTGGWGGNQRRQFSPRGLACQGKTRSGSSVSI